MKLFTKPNVEATKEGLRYLLFLVISWLVAGALQYFVQLPQTEVTAVGVLVLRWLDKYLYESKKYKLSQF